MASVKVKFKPSSCPEKQGSIYYQVIHEHTLRQISTDYRIYKTEWNHRRKTVTCRKESDRLPYLLSVREGIKIDMQRLARVMRSIEKVKLDYSSDDIVNEYERSLEENCLFSYMDNIILKLKKNGRLRTAETYRSALNSFRSFRNGEDIMLEGIDRDIMEAYEAWLRHRGIVPNTISFYARILRAVYNRAVEEDLTDDRHPFRKIYTGVDKTVKRALPLGVIKKIKDIDLHLTPDLEFARDMFILSFMLRGMSFIDMAYLRKKDLRNGILTYRRRKTGQLLTIEWTKDMQTLLDKYSVKDTVYLLPIVRNHESIAHYVYRNASYKINSKLKVIARQLGISIPLTMYVARHSWASAAKSKGIPVGVISEGMGHDSEQTTRIYLAGLDTSIVDRANAILLNDLCS